MSEHLLDLATTQFTTAMELKLQQQGSKLRDKCRQGMHQGKMAAAINQVAAIAATSPAGRFAPKSNVNAAFTRRWVFPQDSDDNQLIDQFDLLRTNINPQSEYVENAANAIGRAWDDAIISAAFGTAQIGTDSSGLSSETLDTTKFQIADNFKASAATGLTVAKLIEARRIFQHYHVDLDMEEPTLVIGSQQEADLLNQVQVVSTDYNDRPVLVDGRVRRILGFNVVCIERLPLSGSDREVLAFVKSGMHFGIWGDLQTSVSIRRDLSSEPVQIYSKSTYGATRTQPGKVIQILCADSTGADITP